MVNLEKPSSVGSPVWPRKHSAGASAPAGGQRGRQGQEGALEAAFAFARWDRVANIFLDSRQLPPALFGACFALDAQRLARSLAASHDVTCKLSGAAPRWSASTGCARRAVRNEKPPPGRQRALMMTAESSLIHTAAASSSPPLPATTARRSRRSTFCPPSPSCVQHVEGQQSAWVPHKGIVEDEASGVRHITVDMEVGPLVRGCTGVSAAVQLQAGLGKSLEQATCPALPPPNIRMTSCSQCLAVPGRPAHAPAMLPPPCCRTATAGGAPQ